MKDFLKPNGKADDKAWLYDRILTYITNPNEWERITGNPVQPRSERDIYIAFAPTTGGTPRHIQKDNRYTWASKNRKVKRDMIAATLRRLVRDGKIRVHSTIDPRRKSMHGRDVKQRKTDIHLFGPEHDGVIRRYEETNVLDAIVAALEGADG